MTESFSVDPEILRADVRDKYRAVAADPGGTFHFHTGRPLAALLGYDREVVESLPDRAVESFAGVGNPFSLRRIAPGERVVDVGSGAGFDSFIAALQTGPTGRVIGIDMTPEMLGKSRATAEILEYDRVEFCEGLAETMPIETRWAPSAGRSAKRTPARSTCTATPSSPTAPEARQRRRVRASVA